MLCSAAYSLNLQIFQLPSCMGCLSQFILSVLANWLPLVSLLQLRFTMTANFFFFFFYFQQLLCRSKTCICQIQFPQSIANSHGRIWTEESQADLSTNADVFGIFFALIVSLVISLLLRRAPQQVALLCVLLCTVVLKSFLLKPF